MSVQEFSQGPRFAIFRPHGRKCHNSLFFQTGARRCRGPRCIAPIAPVLKAPGLGSLEIVGPYAVAGVDYMEVKYPRG